MAHSSKWLLIGFASVLCAALVACGGGSKTTEKVFSTQNEELDVYDISTGKMTVLIPITGWVNGPICVVPDSSGSLLMAEDKNEEKGVHSGWSIFTKDGKFERKIPEPISPTNEPKSLDPMGCAFDSQKRLFTTDVGEESFTGASGKLILFFPPDYTTYCILSDKIHTAGPPSVDNEDGSVLVAETSAGDVLRFSQPFPKDSDGCAAAANVSTFIKDTNVVTPSGTVRAPNGNWYVASVFLPTAINEYDKNGTFVRTIASGSDIGNPEGIAVDSKGTIYYADLGLVPKDSGLPGPGKDKGTVRKVTFDKDGKPQAPVIIGSGLNFPDGVSVLRVKE